MTSSVKCLLVLMLAGCAGFERGDPPQQADAAALPDGSTIPEQPSSGRFDSVHAVLVRECEGCHGRSGIAAGTDLVLTDDAGRDYEAVRSLIDQSEAMSSRLLTKMRGEDHGGGAVLVADAEEYQSIVDWIDDGAMR